MDTPTLHTLAPLSRPAAGRALAKAFAAEPELTAVRFDALARLQHQFRKGHRQSSWTTRDYLSPADSFTPTLLAAAAEEGLIVVEKDFSFGRLFNGSAATGTLIRLAPEHQVELLMTYKLVGEWDAGPWPLMAERGPLIAPLLADHALLALTIDPLAAFYTVLRSAAPHDDSSTAWMVADRLACIPQDSLVEAAGLLRMLALLSPFAGTVVELYRTAQAVLQ